MQGGKTIGNKSKRFQEKEAFVENPGPGSYHVERYTEFRPSRSAPTQGTKDKALGVSIVAF